MQQQSPNSNIKSSKIRQKQRFSLNKTKSNSSRRRKAQIKHQTIMQIRKDLLQRFHQFNISQSLTRIYSTFKKTMGRHSVTNYDNKKHNFKQQWQVTNKYENKQQYKTNFLYGCLKFILLLIMNCCIFGVSVKVFFQINNSEWVYYIVAILSLLKILENLPNIIGIPMKEIILTISKQVVCIILSIILAIQDNQIKWGSALALFIIILMYLNSCKLYSHLKIFHLSSKYRQIVQIIDLFVLLLTISHIFALLLFATTSLHPHSNWLTRINLQGEQWWSKYIYSLYFSCTTLLTIGYGDIAPTNVTQILTILLTQLIGVATFAYAVNQIGAALSNITERAQKMQKDLGNVEQIGNQYRLKPQLIDRMRTQLIKDKTLDSQLNVNEENQLFGKFSQDLRQQIQVESSMRVIKRSMFMIGNWTGKLQSKIARKLIKQIYAIDEYLPQHQGKQKIYILDKGKIQIISNTRMGFKVCFQKVLKTLSVTSSNQVMLQSVYGYSAVISNRQIHLNAVAKSNVICYSLSKSDMYELLAESQQDLQHFHQIKSKIDLSKIPQQVEAPSIINFYEHYCPSVHYIIAQNFYKQNKKNSRISVLRNRRKIKLRCFNQDTSSVTILSRKQKIWKSNFCKDQIFSIGKFSQADQVKEEPQKISNNRQQQLTCHLDQQFQSCKQFQRYFKKSNYQNVLNRLKTRICKTSIKHKKPQQLSFKIKEDYTASYFT